MNTSTEIANSTFIIILHFFEPLNGFEEEEETGQSGREVNRCKHNLVLCHAMNKICSGENATALDHLLLTGYPNYGMSEKNMPFHFERAYTSVLVGVIYIPQAFGTA